MAKKAKKVPFDPKVFLATVNGGRTVASYRKGEVIFSQGKPADAVFYIQRGKVKITVVSEQGKEAVVAVLGPDEFCGEGCLTGQPLHLATAAAMTECEIMRLEKGTMVRVLLRTSDRLPVSGETRDVAAQHRPSRADEFWALMHIQQKHERQQGARRQIGYFKEQVCFAFRGGFLSHLLSQSQEAQNEEYYDHDADDVENVHVYFSGSMCGFNKKWRSNRKRIATEQSSIDLALKTERYSRAINSSTRGLSRLWPGKGMERRVRRVLVACE